MSWESTYNTKKSTMIGIGAKVEEFIENSEDAYKEAKGAKDALRKHAEALLSVISGADKAVGSESEDGIPDLEVLALVKMWGVLRFYESRMSQIASEITDDPHDFSAPISKQVATQLCVTPEFKVVREEMQDATERNMHLRRAVHMPIKVGDHKLMMYFLAESRGGRMLIDLIGCPDDIKENTIQAISKSMLVLPA